VLGYAYMDIPFKKDDLPDLAQKILGKVQNVIALSGDLGAGKTTLTQEIGKQLGITENMVSPTFVIMKMYDLSSSYPWKKLIHIDAYRLKGSEELLKLGWDDISHNKENLIIIEWPENVKECIDDRALNITLSHTDQNTRTLSGL
jgi:tRNA threonylcarbamoyladenosine biosynthesis protein TsaE